MNKTFEQLPSGRWPSGAAQSLMLLRKLPAELARDHSLAFVSGHDDLGGTTEAGLRLASGRLVLLISYENTPVPGTEVQIDSADNPSEARKEVESALALDDDQVVWARDDSRAEAAGDA